MCTPCEFPAPLNFVLPAGRDSAASEPARKRPRVSQDADMCIAEGVVAKKETSDGLGRRKPRMRGSVSSCSDVVFAQNQSSQMCAIDEHEQSDARHDAVSASLSSVVSRLLAEQPEIELSSIYVDAVAYEQAVARNISSSHIDNEVVSISSEEDSTSSM